MELAALASGRGHSVDGEEQWEKVSEERERGEERAKKGGRGEKSSGGIRWEIV